MQVSEKDICISLLEMEREFLVTISPDDMDRLRAITDVVTDLLWLKGANMMSNDPNPNLTLSGGLSRTLMLEQPALRFSILDVGRLQSEFDVLSTCENAMRELLACREADDCAFVQTNGLLHICRFDPDFALNSLFRRRQEPDGAMEKKTLAAAGSARAMAKKTLAAADSARLSIDRAGVTDSMYILPAAAAAATHPASRRLR